MDPIFLFEDEKRAHQQIVDEQRARIKDDEDRLKYARRLLEETEGNTGYIKPN